MSFGPTIGQEDVGTQLGNLLERIIQMEERQATFEEVIVDFSMSLVNSFMSWAASTTGNMVADALMAVPYIGPLLAALGRSVIPMIMTLPMQTYRGSAL